MKGERRGNRTTAENQMIREVTRDTFFNLEGLEEGETLCSSVTKTGDRLFRVTFVSDGQDRVKVGVSNLKVRVTRDGEELK